MNKPIPVSLGKLSIAAIAAIVALLILWNGTGEAQDPSPTVSVSNAGKNHDAELTVGGNIWFAQSFCTGATYTTLEQVSIFASDPYRMNPRVTLHRARIWSPGPPGNYLHTLTKPASFDSSHTTSDDFTTTGYQLAPNTLYWIVVRKDEIGGTGWFRASGTNSNGLDSGGMDGWKLGRMVENGQEAEAQRLRIAIYADSASPSHHPARFPRSCQEADYPSIEKRVVETTPANTVIATLTALDPDGDTLTYSVSGPDAAAFNEVFALNASTGEIRIKAGATLDYEARTRYSVRVDVSDGKDDSGNTESAATVDDSTYLTINIRDDITDNPFTAQAYYVPVCHAGEAFTFVVQFSEAPSINYLTLRDHAFTVTGGGVTGARRLDRGNHAWWQMRVQPVSDAPVTVVLPATTDCEAEGAICTSDGRMLSSRLELAVLAPASQQLAANAPATGWPVIDGILQVGRTLTAGTSGIADEDGLADEVFAYQWIRHDLATATDVDIEGATGRNYTVEPEDQGKGLKVRVSFTDDWGNAESLTSNAALVPPPPALRLESATVNGAALVLTYNESLDEGVSIPTGAFPVTVAGSARAVTGVSVVGKTVNLTLASSVSAGETVMVGYARPGGPDFIRDIRGYVAGSFSSRAATNSTPGQPDANTPPRGAAVIEGTARVGETLRANTSGISDGDGMDDAVFTYRWLAGNREIADATRAAYLVTPADVGKTIGVRVSFTDDAATSAVAATVPSAPQRLRASPHDTGALDLHWEAPASDGGSAATGYKVQWKEAGDGWDTPEDVSETTTTGTTLTITGLTGGTDYAVRVIAVNAVGYGAPSEEATGTPRETTPPELSTATVNGATLTLTYDETLDGNSVPAANAFSVSVGGAGRAVSAAAVSGAAVILTLISAVESGQAVTVSYTAPADDGAARIRDAAGNAAASFSGQAAANETPEPAQSPPEGEEVPQPLTASIQGGPATHDGQNSFTFELRFSEEFSISYKTLRDHAFTVHGGSVTGARRLDPPSNIGWEVHVGPSSDAGVTVVLPVTTDCGAQGAICTQGGRKLSNRLEFTVSGPGG